MHKDAMKMHKRAPTTNPSLPPPPAQDLCACTFLQTCVPPPQPTPAFGLRSPPYSTRQKTQPPPPPPPPGARLLVESGVIPGGAPPDVAAFLRGEHAARLSREMVGELLGDHEDFSVEVGPVFFVHV